MHCSLHIWSQKCLKTISLSEFLAIFFIFETLRNYYFQLKEKFSRTAKLLILVIYGTTKFGWNDHIDSTCMSRGRKDTYHICVIQIFRAPKVGGFAHILGFPPHSRWAVRPCLKSKISGHYAALYAA